jgi:hypothetical protein
MISNERKVEEKMKVFPLPPEVSWRKEISMAGQQAYMFRHEELGDFGRLLIFQNGKDCQLMFEVIGDEDDPMTSQRKAIFEPISRDISNFMELTFGKGAATFKPYETPNQMQQFMGERIVCNRCDTCVAFIVYAPPNATEASLQDHARMGFAKGKEFNVPTWVISEESIVLVNNQRIPRLSSLKVFPEREPTTLILGTELDDILCPLVEYHCKRRP